MTAEGLRAAKTSHVQVAEVLALAGHITDLTRSGKSYYIRENSLRGGASAWAELLEAVWSLRRADETPATQLVAECEPFLKEDETPAQCIARNRADTDAVLTLLVKEKRRTEAGTFQARVLEWMRSCFSRQDALHPAQRSFRFLEEALELGQAVGTSREDAQRLVEYVYARPTGQSSQEGGGVMVTLAGLLGSLGFDLTECAEGELRRCIDNTDKIRAKDLAKPERSPLPGSSEKANAVQPDLKEYPEFEGHDPWCTKCGAPIITIPGFAPGCMRNCPPPVSEDEKHAD